jgi:hypothetical protein
MSNCQRVEKKKNDKQKESTSISKLKCVQNVLAEKIKALKETNPHRKVGIVAFESNVYVVGDGTTP